MPSVFVAFLAVISTVMRALRPEYNVFAVSTWTSGFATGRP